MSPEEKRAVFGLTEEEEQLLANAGNYWNMSKEDQDKFENALLKKANKSHVGGVQQGSFEMELQEDFNISREDLKNKVKNPYKGRMTKEIVIILILQVVSAVLAVAGLGKEIPAVEAPAGILALDFARNRINYFKFRKLQDKYVGGELTEDEIQAEMYRQLLDEMKKEKETEKNL